MIYKEKKTPAVLHSSARGQLLQKAILVHSVQASVISRAGMWHWSLHLLILHLRELNAKVLREEVAPYELRVCASFLTCVCKSLFFFSPSPWDFAVRHRWFFPPKSNIDMACVLQRGFIRVVLGVQASLFYFASALAAFLATAGMNESKTNQQGFLHQLQRPPEPRRSLHGRGWVGLSAIPQAFDVTPKIRAYCRSISLTVSD